MRHVLKPYALVVAVAATALAVAGWRVGWSHLLLSPDQAGRLRLQRGDAVGAAEAFRDPMWRGVALFRAGDFKVASQVFSGLDTAEGAYDSGNTLVMLGQYEAALKRFDRALELKSDWLDAEANREIARIRAERMKQKGGVNDNTESAPDEVIFDKTKNGGDDTIVQAQQAMSDSSVRAMWLKRVQTKPADFLRVKFSYQLQKAGGVP